MAAGGTLDRFKQTVQKQYLNLFWGSYATLKPETKRNNQARNEALNKHKKKLKKYFNTIKYT